MDTLIQHSLRVVVFGLMLIVGLDCTPDRLRKSLKPFGLTVTVVVGQFLFIPLLVFGVCRLCPMTDELRSGLLLFACCPTGTISNTYTFLARGNTARSVSLTAASVLFALAGTPLALALVQRLSGHAGESFVQVPPGAVFRELLFMMTLPLVLGYVVRRRWPGIMLRYRKAFSVASLLLVLGILVLIAASAPSAILQKFRLVLLPALVLTPLLAGAGYGLGLLFRCSPEDRVAVMFELPCRNLAIVALIGLTVLHEPALVLLATAYFLAEAVVLLALLRAKFLLPNQP